MKPAVAILASMLVAGLSHAQVGSSPSARATLASINQQSVRVPASTSATLLNLTVDAPPAGQDLIDAVVPDSSIVVSLIRPDGVEVTVSNATSLGYTFSTYSADGTGDSTDTLSPFLFGGAHTVIQFPLGTPSGVYQLKANSSAYATDTVMQTWYYPSSSVKMGALTDAANYRQGDLVILSGLVFDATTPIQNATVTAVAGTLLPVAGTVGSYQLVGTSQVTCSRLPKKATDGHVHGRPMICHQTPTGADRAVHLFLRGPP